MQQFAIDGRPIGPGHPTYIIAEAGVNHNGNVGLAQMLIDAAVHAGADAVKFQTFTAKALASEDAPKADYQLKSTDPRESQVDMLRRLEIAPQAFRTLAQYCKERSITFLSTPFDSDSVELLVALNVPAFKVASGEITNHLLLRRIGATGRPAIISSGMSTMAEVERAVRVTRDAGCPAVSLLHCLSNYPADPAEVNLNAMHTMRDAFSVPVGFSDHTMGSEISIAAVALGASIIEKHLTLDRNMEGPDHAASLEPVELRSMISSIRNVEAALGSGIKEPAASELGTRNVARRSLVLRRDIRKGGIISADDLDAKRPAGGIGPDLLDRVIGKMAANDMRAGSILTWSDFA